MKWLSIGPVVTTCVGIGFDIARKYDATVDHHPAPVVPYFEVVRLRGSRAW